MDIKTKEEDNCTTFAQEITENLLNSFSPEDQRRVLNQATINVNEDYENRINNLKVQLTAVMNDYDTFQGNVPQKKG